MAFLQPAPVLGRTTVKRLAHQVSKLSRSSSSWPLSIANPTSVAKTTTTSFVCRKCLHTSNNAKFPLSVVSSVPRYRTSQNQYPVSSFARLLNTSSSKKTATAAPFDSKYETDSTAASTENTKSKTKSFPETSSKSVAYWLLGSAASVFGIVVFGGLTRLTESGFVLSRLPIYSIPSKALWASR